MKNQVERFVMIALTCALLAACGGNDGDSAPPPMPGPTQAVPPGASESSAGLVKYLKDLTAATAEDIEPVGLGTFMPKTPEDAEPEPVS